MLPLKKEMSKLYSYIKPLASYFATTMPFCTVKGQTIQYVMKSSIFMSKLLCAAGMLSQICSSLYSPTLLRQSWENTTPFRELIKKMPGRVMSLPRFIKTF